MFSNWTAFSVLLWSFFERILDKFLTLKSKVQYILYDLLSKPYIVETNSPSGVDYEHSRLDAELNLVRRKAECVNHPRQR